MPPRSYTVGGKRRLTLSVLEMPADPLLMPPFVTLLAAYNAVERQAAAGLAKALIDRGCVEFCCIGPEAELLHDALDDMIETEGTLDVVTTWIDDPKEGCEYFVHAAAGASANLLALVQSHPELQAILEREAG